MESDGHTLALCYVCQCANQQGVEFSLCWQKQTRRLSEQFIIVPTEVAVLELASV